MGKQRTGKDGESIVLRVPVGTEILEEDEGALDFILTHLSE